MENEKSKYERELTDLSVKYYEERNNLAVNEIKEILSVDRRGVYQINQIREVIEKCDNYLK